MHALWVHSWFRFLSGVSVAGALVGFIPQFAGPGYESALAAGLLLPTPLAIAAALSTLQGTQSAIRTLANAIWLGVAAGLCWFLVGLLHALRVGWCDPAWGVQIFWLGGGAGAVMGSTFGACAGLGLRHIQLRRAKRTLAICVACSGPLAGIALSLWRFYTSPMVFAFDPFFGYFSGPLYDTVIDGIPELITYRAGSLATLLAVLCLALLCEVSDDGRLSWAYKKRVDLIPPLVLSAAISLGISSSGPALGHYQSASSIESALGRKLRSGRCEVVYSSVIAENEVALLATECNGYLRELERFFESAAPEVRVYLFASDAEKGRLMGAARTYIAKPWRHEVYVQHAPFPHPVLGHELAHVVAGGFGRGPFKVAGPVFGLIPDPGRIEGVAVAAVADDSEDLSVMDSAAAMLKLGLLPELSSLFRLSFLGKNASAAYAVAGAFMYLFRAEFGAAALRTWYGGATLEQATQGQSLAVLEQRWHEMLHKHTVPDTALALAQARFSRPSLFGRRCPRIVDKLAREATYHLAAGDIQGAEEGYAELLTLDPGYFPAQLALAQCAYRRGQPESARRMALSLADNKDLDLVERDQALEFAADIELWRGEMQSAREKYTAIEARTYADDHLRGLEVKSSARNTLEQRSISALLIGEPEPRGARELAIARLSHWASIEQESGLPAYLLGKNLYLRGHWAEAAQYLDRSLNLGLQHIRVEREVLRMRVVLACALGTSDSGTYPLARVLSTGEPQYAHARTLTRLWERCTGRPR